MTITGVPGSTATDHFLGGYLIHNSTGQIFTMIGATGASGDTVVRLGHWIADFTAGDQVKLFPGCNRSTGHCTSKFNNAANFGGFSHIPDRNPTFHGV